MHMARPVNWVPPLMKASVRALLCWVSVWNNWTKTSLASSTWLFELHFSDLVGSYSLLWIQVLSSPNKDLLQFCPACLILKSPFCSKGFHSLGPDFLNWCHISISVCSPPLFFLSLKGTSWRTFGSSRGLK